MEREELLQRLSISRELVEKMERTSMEINQAERRMNEKKEEYDRYDSSLRGGTSYFWDIVSGLKFGPIGFAGVWVLGFVLVIAIEMIFGYHFPEDLFWPLATGVSIGWM